MQLATKARISTPRHQVTKQKQSQSGWPPSGPFLTVGLSEATKGWTWRRSLTVTKKMRCETPSQRMCPSLAHHRLRGPRTPTDRAQTVALFSKFLHTVSLFSTRSVGLFLQKKSLSVYGPPLAGIKTATTIPCRNWKLETGNWWKRVGTQLRFQFLVSSFADLSLSGCPLDSGTTRYSMAAEWKTTHGT